jgi:hypothetical protein
VEQVPNPTGVDPITGSEQKEAKIKKKKKQNKTQNKNKKQQTTASQSSLQTYNHRLSDLLDSALEEDCTDHVFFLLSNQVLQFTNFPEREEHQVLAWVCGFHFYKRTPSVLIPF